MRRSSVAKTLALLLSAACGSNGGLGDPASHKAEAAEELARVSVSDGVSRSEAEAIASYFFYYHVDIGCGAPGAITENPESWSIATRLGFAGEPGDDIIVNKTDGSVHWGGRRCVDNPLSMLSDPSGASLCRP